jgi:hypothetical protein
MEFLKNIDWQNHNGVNLPMINDFVRNQFYDRILSRYVPGQDCVDIGFGTGLLSMIALKHGARHITAYESDTDRYLLGQTIINELGLNDQIELINEHFDRNYHQKSVTFSEIVDGNLWWEGLWYSLPTDPKQIFLPGEYFLEIWATVVPKKFAQGLCRQGQSQSCFNPGIDIDSQFVDLINQLQNIVVGPELPLPAGIVCFERQQDTDWGWVPYQRAVHSGKIVAKYSAQHFIAGLTQFELEVDTSAWQDQCVLIVPRVGMKQDNDVLYLDVGHWGPAVDPILLVCPNQNLVIKHNVINGQITYSLE